MTGPHDQEADEHRHRPGEVAREVERIGGERGAAVRCGTATRPWPARRRSRSRRRSRRAPPSRARLREETRRRIARPAMTTLASERNDASASAASARPCRARTGGRDRRGGPRRRSRGRSGGPRRGRCPSGPPRRAARGCARRARRELQHEQPDRRHDRDQRRPPLRAQPATSSSGQTSTSCSARKIAVRRPLERERHERLADEIETSLAACTCAGQWWSSAR